MVAVVFDLDGTLIHSAPDIHACLNRVVTEAGAASFTLAEVTGFIGNGVPKLIERAIRARGLGDAAQTDFETRFLAFYNADPVALTRPFEGVPEALESLRAAGFRLGVCTNKPQAPARDILSLLDLDTYFDVILGGDGLPQRKPHPAPLLATLDILDGPGVFVGDSEVDAECAARAQVPFLLFSGGYRKAEVSALRTRAVFRRFGDLPRLVRSLDSDVPPTLAER